MKRIAVLAVAVMALGVAAPSVRAQDTDNGGRLPGAQTEHKLEGGPGYVCTARNALGTQQCTTSCPSRESANCEDADGSATPTCQCTGG